MLKTEVVCVNTQCCWPISIDSVAGEQVKAMTQANGSANLHVLPAGTRSINRGIPDGTSPWTRCFFAGLREREMRERARESVVLCGESARERAGSVLACWVVRIAMLWTTLAQPVDI
jgi:hypothetical protein